MLQHVRYWMIDNISECFNGHPPLGVNATYATRKMLGRGYGAFPWAPTLGGECYLPARVAPCASASGFNGHPPLGVNATQVIRAPLPAPVSPRFNGHPPLGVNATEQVDAAIAFAVAFQWAPTLGTWILLNLTILCVFAVAFQWAPTLGGECYWHRRRPVFADGSRVSMGTHPWG